MKSVRICLVGFTPFSPLNSSYSPSSLRLALNKRKRGYLSDLADGCFASLLAASNLAKIKFLVAGNNFSAKF